MVPIEYLKRKAGPELVGSQSSSISERKALPYAFQLCLGSTVTWEVQDLTALAEVLSFPLSV